VTSTLTINTTAATAAAIHNPLRRIFTTGGGGMVMALLFFCLPFRRRKWQSLFSLLVFLAITGTVIGCGGGSTNQGLTNPPPNSGTTLGSYTVTVTGTSGSTTKRTAVTVVVN